MEKCIYSKNGVPIYYNLNPSLHSININIYFRCGAMYEKITENGITHFFEHIVFRNIDKLYGGCLYEILDRNAINFNASTYKEFMYFSFSLFPEATNIVLDIIEKFFSKIILKPQEVDVERNIVKSELYEEDEKGTLNYICCKEVWKGTTLEQSVLGSCASLNKITRRKLADFRKRLFLSGDMFVYITGCATESTAKMVEKILSNSDIEKQPQKLFNMAPVPDDFCNRNLKLIIKDCDYTLLRLNFDFIRKEVEFAEIDLLFDYLFSGESSQFYKELNYKTGLIYSYDPILEKYSNVGNLSVCFELKLSKLYETLETIVSILNKVKYENIDLSCAKAIYSRAEIMNLDSPNDLNWEKAYCNHICDVDFSDEERSKLHLGVTSQRLSDIAKKIFTTDRLVLAIKGKKSSIKECEVKNIIEKLNYKM